MSRSVVLALALLLAWAPSAAASEHGRVEMPTSILVAVVIAATAALLALLFALTAPSPGGHARPETQTNGDYAAGLSVAIALGLLALAQFLPWGALEFTSGDAERVYPWGYENDLGGSGSWFGTEGPGHIDLKVAMVLHYVGLVALVPMLFLVWRRPDDTRRTAALLATLAVVHALAFFVHMDGASAAVNDSRFATFWGGWVAVLGIVAIAVATLIVARFSSAVVPPGTNAEEALLVPGAPLPAPSGGWAANVLDRTAGHPAAPQPRWDGAAPAQRPQPPSSPERLPPAPWDPPTVATPQPVGEKRSDLVRLHCPKCQHLVEAVRGVRPICPACGFGRP